MEGLNRTGICRLCADIKDSFLRIYDEEGYKLAIGIKINKYLQIQVMNSICKLPFLLTYLYLSKYSN